jgi:colicin import membrane protein
MQGTVQGPEFTPPPEGSLLRSFAFALVAHLMLVLALSVGVQWKRDDDKIAVEAELWAPTVQQAAPKPVEAPPPPPPPPPQVEKQVVQPPPPAPPAPPVPNEAEIALEREREQAAKDKAREDEAERQRKLAAERKRQDDLEKQQQAKKAADEQRRREEQAKKAEDEQRRREEQAKVRRDEQAKARREKQDEERLAKLREENLKRIQGLAGATGSPTSTGTALQSAGPSASYAGRVVARIKPNIVYTDNVPGNPRAEVEVRLAPDGTIIGRRLSKSSGVPGWDEAVLRAFDRTEQFPRDIDGRVPSSMTLGFRPKDL